MKYRINAKVDQVVTKEVVIELEANSEDEAVDKARQALQTYPESHDVEGVTLMCTVKSEYYIPRDVTFPSVKRKQ